MTHKTKFQKLPFFNFSKNFQGNLAFQNINIDFKMTLAAFPAGLYHNVLKLSDESDGNIFTIIFMSEIISKDRKEFK